MIDNHGSNQKNLKCLFAVHTIYQTVPEKGVPLVEPFKILYTIPNFNTAGSGIPLLKIAQEFDRNYFIPEIACLHDKGDLFQDVMNQYLLFVN